MLPPKKVDDWIKNQLFDDVPVGIVAIDQAFNIVFANKRFEKRFGPWHGRKCYSVYRNRYSICPQCSAAKAFKDGMRNVNEEAGYDKDGNLIRYIKHTIPIFDEDGDIPFLIEMGIDVTESAQIRREYELLFDQVPCNILLIDRDFRIVKTNAKVREMLGNLEGEHCFHGLKGRAHKCDECTARQTFEDGKLHTGHHVWKTKDGQIVHQHVITIPLRLIDDSDDFDIVMEMAVDVTQTLQLEEGLRFAHSFLETLISSSMDGIFAIDQRDEVSIFNTAAREFFKIEDGRRVLKSDLTVMLPEGLFEKVAEAAGPVFLPETTIHNAEGKTLPVRLVSNQIVVDQELLGTAFFIQDLSELKQLQDEKLEAERLAAVGQTVAGLAHGVKNLITAIEGGMYMLRTGIQKGDLERLKKGVDMLQRNVERIAMFVKTFLDFSKGREIRAKVSRPEDIAQEVVDNYTAEAKKLGIDLTHECMDVIEPAPIDYETMHECLTNLVGNAIDACRVSEDKKGTFVRARTFEKNGAIIYEVADNGCGIDYDIRKKVFTTFFTTKGLGGTGLGLLMTRKIVQEHGGRIDLESEPGKGTVFRISLPRRRLPEIASGDDAEDA
ncbi:MAG: ATP-binding protein [Thermodesulfobacteriota bacterium]|nr:ATP-binding protein [Thermodesulfobacteriota bacterium]